MSARLLYVCPDFTLSQSASAVRARFHVDALRDAGFQVEVLSCQDERQAMSDQAHLGGVAFVSSKLASNQAALVFRLLAEVRVGLHLAAFALRHRASYCGVILSSPPFFANAVLSFALILARCSYVFDVRDRYPQVLFSVGVLRSTSLVGRCLLWVERCIYARAKVVTTVTHSLSREIARATTIQPHVVRNGYDASEFSESVHRGPTEPAGKPIILMHGLFGQLFDDRAFEQIARYCLGHAPAHQFVLAGYGPKLDGILALDLPNVRYVGHLSHGDVVEWLRRATIGLSMHTNQPSTMAGFAVKVFEFIGAGLPSVVLPRGEAGIEVEREGLGWSFDNSSWELAAETIVRAIQSPSGLESVIQTVHQKRSGYSRQAQAMRFAACVKDVFS